MQGPSSTNRYTIKSVSSKVCNSVLISSSNARGHSRGVIAIEVDVGIVERCRDQNEAASVAAVCRCDRKEDLDGSVWVMYRRRRVSMCLEIVTICSMQ